MNPLSPALAQVLEIFRSELSDVRFGDVDAESLSRLSAEVEALAHDVDEAQRALATARAALEARLDLLTDTAARALAYARVYAERDPALATRIDAIPLGRTGRRARFESGAALVLTGDPPVAKRPRGRPRKTQPAAALPLESAASPSEGTARDEPMCATIEGA